MYMSNKNLSSIKTIQKTKYHKNYAPHEYSVTLNYKNIWIQLNLVCESLRYSEKLEKIVVLYATGYNHIIWNKFTASEVEYSKLTAALLKLKVFEQIPVWTYLITFKNV